MLDLCTVNKSLSINITHHFVRNIKATNFSKGRKQRGTYARVTEIIGKTGSHMIV